MKRASTAEEQLQLGSRPKALARRSARVAQDEPELPPEDSKPLPAFTLAPFARCPTCGGAAEDGRRLRAAPFRGTACVWCGARVGLRDFPDGAWGVVTLVHG